MGHCDTMTERPRITIDVRKLGDTGVGRSASGLVAGLATTPGANDFTWRLLGHRDRWQHLGTTPPGTRLTNLHSGVYSPWQHPEVALRLFQRGADLLHATHFTTPLVLPRHTRLVVTIHDAAFLDRPDFATGSHLPAIRLSAYRVLMHLASRRADTIIVGTRATEADLARLLPSSRGKVRVLPNGIDLARFDPDATTSSDEVILFVGTLSRRKGIGTLVQAYASRPALRRHRLVLVGPDHTDDASALRQLVARLGIEDRVVLTGTIPDDALLEWYRRARVVTLPSLLEGFGYPVIEAMAMGVPCVASDLPPIREVAGGAASLIPPGDVGALGEALERACFENPLRADLIARGLARVPDFSLERIGTQALAIYRDVLGT